ncbi:MAG: hypothetical protein ACHQNA_12215 [Acidimicrobiales bacterium]
MPGGLTPGHGQNRRGNVLRASVVFLNGRPLSGGDDSYRTRDYRFLGSIGWSDAVYLPLAEGDNEFAVAVLEDFGGWGVQARFPDPDWLSFS